MQSRVFPWFLCLGPLASLAAEPSHCSSAEQTFFNCSMKNGKVASVCGSQGISASEGYVQYRFGAPGRIELRLPSTLVNTQKQFSLESNRPNRAESEFLTFTIGKYEYSVYETAGTDQTPVRLAGVLVLRANAGGASTYADLKCAASHTERLSALKDIVPVAE